jgi:hypothetical protein
MLLVLRKTLGVEPNQILAFHPNGKLAFSIVGPPTRIPEVEGNPLLEIKPRPFPAPKTNLDVVTRMDVVGKLTPGKPMEGKEVIDGIPHMEKPYVLSMVVEEPIPLMNGNEDVKETPPIAIGVE